MSWDIVRLGDFFVTTSGGTPMSSNKSYYENGTIPWLNSGEVNQGIIYKSEKFITQAGLDNSSAKIIPKGSVLIAMYGATAGVVGLLYFKSAINQAICAVMPHRKVLPSFLFAYLKTQKNVLLGKTSGGAQPNISQEIIKSLNVPIPPLDEQRRIATEIEHQLVIAERAKQAAKEQLAIAQALNAAYLREVFVENKGVQTRLGDVCVFEGGSQPPKTTFRYSKQDGYIRLIQIQDYRRDDVAVYIPENLARRFCKKDDVMIGRYGPPVFQILRGLEGAYNVALMKAYPKDNGRLDNGFLYYLLQEENIQNAVIEQSQRSAGQTGVDKDFLESRNVCLPDIATQQRIVSVVEKRLMASAKTRAVIQSQLNTINVMPAAILRQAFSGQI